MNADDARTAPIGDLIERDEREVPSPTTVHALLLLYEATEELVQTWAASVETALAPHGVKVVHRLPLSLRLDENDVGREHFGFADGLSHPIPYDEEGAGAVLSTGDRSRRIPGTACRSARSCSGIPMRTAKRRPARSCHTIPTTRAARATRRGPAGGRCAGRLPKLRPQWQLHGGARTPQDVAAFWSSLELGAATIRANDPTATHVTADWLAERVVGRTVSKSDPHGRGCPPGSHVRRANPRDGIAKDPVTAQTQLDATNNHRILRRGRKFGGTIAQRDQDDGKERGLLFICLNTDISRQFEFIQQHWILNRNFATLFDETDPLVGPKGGFTIRDQPLRRIVEMETFVQSAGGEYFFLPSIPALSYLAVL